MMYDDIVNYLFNFCLGILINYFDGEDVYVGVLKVLLMYF